MTMPMTFAVSNVHGRAPAAGVEPAGHAFAREHRGAVSTPRTTNLRVIAIEESWT